MSIKYILAAIMFMVLIIPGALAWGTNTFNNSLSSETLTYAGNSNVTRYLAVPSGTFVINGYLNLTGYVPLLYNPSNLSAYWKFNQSSGSAIDFFGRNNLTVVGATNYEAGKIGNASNFSNGNFLDSSGGIPETTFNMGNWTMAFWVYPTQSVAAATIYANRPDGASSPSAVQFGMVSQKLTFTHTGATAAGSYDIPLNVWTQVTIVKAGTNLSYWYNGTLFDSFTIPNDNYGNLSYDVQLGCVDDTCPSGTENLRGKLDDFRVYNGYALNGTDIQAIWNSGNGQEFIGNPNSNVTLFVGDTSGELNMTIAANGTTPITVRTSNLRNYVNSYTSSCTLIGGYCNVPFVFKAYGAGSINYSNLVFDTLSFIENNQTFTTPVTEATNNVFSINITFDTNFYTSSSASITYNGTTYSGSPSGSGNNRIFTTSISAPHVTVSTAKLFYWNIYLTNSSGTFTFNSTVYNQTVNPTAVDDCSTYTNLLINFTALKNEDSLTNMNVPNQNNSFLIEVKIGDFAFNNYFTYSTNRSNVNSAPVCLQNAVTGSNRMDVIVQYTSNGFVNEFYNIQYFNLTASTMAQNVTLYPLLSNRSTEFIITIKDENYLPLTDALVQIDRKYIQNGNFLTVEVPKTDNQGVTIGHFVTSDIIYNIYIKKNGELLASFENQRLTCVAPPDCAFSLNLPGSTVNPQDFTFQQGVYYIPFFNASTNTYTVQFIAQDGASKTMRISGILLDPSGNTSICSQTITATSGTLTCQITAPYQNSTVLIQTYVNGNLLFANYIHPSYSRYNVLNKSRYIIAAFILMFFVLMAGSSAVMALVFFILGFIFTVALFLIDTQSYIGIGSIIMYIVLAMGVLIYKIVKGGVQNG